MLKVSQAFRSAAGAALLAGLAMGGAAAQDSPPSAYVGVGGGLNLLQDQDFGTAKVDAKSGWAALGTLGYRWGGGLRTEIEGATRHNKANFLAPTVPLTNIAGKVTATSLMANALIDLDFGMPVVPYIGGGVGALRAKYAFPSTVKDTEFAFQGIAGATFKFSPTFEMFADYRYITTSGQNFPLNGRVSSEEYRSHGVMAGLRWTFWSGAAKPAPVAAAPAPVVATPKDYTIYFEFDKANITDAAGAVLDEIKSNTTPAQSVSVVGHTDTSGSNEYNAALSDRRAKNTASGLQSRGVGVGSVTGVGETEPAVPTPDGVKEPLNRRSVIKILPGSGT